MATVEAKVVLPNPAHLRVELQTAYQDMMSYIEELQQVLALPRPDRARLTTVRLQLAKLRLVHGPLITKISALATARATAHEAEEFKELRCSNDALLRLATAHIGKWNLEAVEADWSGYRESTRELLQRWTKKIHSDRQLVDEFLAPGVSR